MPARSRHPVAALSVVAAIPALLLGVLTWYAGARADEGTVSVSTEPVVAQMPQQLTTKVLSVRRAPTPLAAAFRARVLIAQSAALLDSIDSTSCAAVALDDRTVASKNLDTTVIPASNLKVVVAAAALDILGPAATFTTSVVGAAPTGGVVQGDVYLVGGGDPVLSEAWYTQPSGGRKRPPIHTTSIEALADALVQAGVTSITGRLVGDGSRYDDERHPPGWSNDIRATTDGVPVGALVVNDSVTQQGAIGADPAESATKVFAALLQARGITIAGGTATGVAPAGQSALASVQSAPLTDVLAEMLSTSDNLSAEMLVKELGHAVGGAGTRAAGLQAITARVTGWGVPVAGLQLTDGSGLSRDNQLTCATLLAVLQRGSASDPVGAGLARGAQAGSTLADYFQDAGLAGVVQAKTGTLTGVKSLSGYFVAGANEVEFVIINNGGTAGNYGTEWKQLGAALLALAASAGVDSFAPQP